MLAKPALRILRLVVPVGDRELAALLWAFAGFFCLLGGYYMLRPVREAMGLAGGVQGLPWLFTATFVTMLLAVPLFGATVARLPRRRFVPLVYRFFLLHILAFAVLRELAVAPTLVAQVFFVWTSVYNLFVVSVFWSAMADLFDSAQGKRLFGFIAAGGTAGTLLGSWITSAVVAPIGLTGVLAVAALLLECTVQCFHRLWRAAETTAAPGTPPRAANAPDVRGEPPIIGGGALTGIGQVVRSPYLLGICAYVLCISAAATFFYFMQAEIVSEAVLGDAARTVLFARINLLVGLCTVLLQLLVTPRMLGWLGVGGTLAATPLLAAGGFIGLVAAPVLAVVAAAQAVFRAARYAMARPAREVLFTVVSREEKYKAKSFIDTVVYRGGDAGSAWVFHGIQSLGSGLATLAAVGLPLAALGLAAGLLLGRKQESLRGR